jgi:hypothetical protein
VYPHAAIFLGSVTVITEVCVFSPIHGLTLIDVDDKVWRGHTLTARIMSDPGASEPLQAGRSGKGHSCRVRGIRFEIWRFHDVIA